MNLPDDPLANEFIRRHFLSFLMASFPDAPLEYHLDLCARARLGRITKDEWLTMEHVNKTHPEYRDRYRRHRERHPPPEPTE